MSKKVKFLVEKRVHCDYLRYLVTMVAAVDMLNVVKYRALDIYYYLILALLNSENHQIHLGNN
jgi:hypothetical protein